MREHVHCWHEKHVAHITVQECCRCGKEIGGNTPMFWHVNDCDELPIWEGSPRIMCLTR